MTPGTLAGRHILVVEDETVITMLLEDILDDLGCVVVGPAARVETALAAFDDERIDGAVLDINLAGMLSYPVADALAARGLPFIFTTGYGEAGLEPAYRTRPVVQKPFTPEALEHALSKLFAE